MKFKLSPPCLIFYSDTRLKDWQDGATFGPVVIIRPTYKNDLGLLAHELFHTKQWWLTLGTHPIWYNLVPKYRYWSEIWAYRRQLKSNPEYIDYYVDLIESHYGLTVSKETIKKHLTTP